MHWCIIIYPNLYVETLLLNDSGCIIIENFPNKFCL